jgi:[calcium/calmodulin-dependent protein kinase] kinase
VTKNGTDPLLSAEENTADLVEPPSEIEVNHAITTKMRGLLAVMKAVKKFKTKLEQKRSDAFSGTLGKGIRVLHPSFGLNDASTKVILHRSKSDDLDDRHVIEGALAAEGIHHEGQFTPEAAQSLINVIDSTSTLTLDEEPKGKGKTPPVTKADDNLTSLPERLQPRHTGSGDKGHAHDPLAEEPLYLGIGAGVGDNESLELPQEEIIAESPTAADFSIYDTAYQEEVERIRAARGDSTTVYLTRRVDHKKEYKADKNMINLPVHSDIKATIQEGWKDLVDRAQEGRDGVSLHQKLVAAREEHSFSDLVSRAVDNTKSIKKDWTERGGSAIENVRHSVMERREEKKAEEQKANEKDKET